MARGQLSELDRLRINNTKLRRGITTRDTKIHTLAVRVKELETQLSDVTFQLEQMKAVVFGKKYSAHKDEDDGPKIPRTPHSYTRPIPKQSEVTHRVFHPAPKNHSKTRTRVFFVEDIPLATKTITEHTVTQYFDGMHWMGDVSLPPKRVVLGINVRMLIATLCIESRLSYSQIQSLLLLLYNLPVSQGEITTILHKEAVLLSPTSERILSSIRDDPYHHLDETSWSVGNDTTYAWSMTGSSGASYYRLGVSRGKGIAGSLRGESTGVLISDDYGAYKHLSTDHQLCWAHLIRKWRDIATHPDYCDLSLTPEYTTLKKLFRDVAQASTTEDASSYSAQYTKELTVLSHIQPTDPPPLVRIKTTLEKNIQKYMTCLRFPHIPLTNNTAERSLRHLVIKRRISYGSRSYKGASSLSVLYTVLKELLRGDPRTYFERYGMGRV